MTPVKWEGKVKPSKKDFICWSAHMFLALSLNLKSHCWAHWCVKVWLCLPFLSIFQKRDPFSRAKIPQ